MKTFIKGGLLFVALWLAAGHVLRSSRAGAIELFPQESKKEVSPEQSARMKELFREKCARCHGADGRGQTVLGDMLDVPDFTDEKWWKEEKSDKRFISSITNGRENMPAFGKKLSRQEISALALFVRGFNRSAR